MFRQIALILSCAALAGCAATDAPLPPDAGGPVGQLDPVDVEQRVLREARERFGDALVAEALNSESYLIAYRGVGGIWVPAPAGEAQPVPPDPRMALIALRNGDWVVADDGAWRQASQSKIEDIETLVTSPGFGGEPVHIPPCPDYPTGRLLMKYEGSLKVARDHGCPSQTDRVIGVALEA